MLKTLALAAIALPALAAPAFADDDALCGDAPRDQWLTLESVVAEVSAKGYLVDEAEVEDGCYEIEALDAAGVAFELMIDPVSGDVLRIERDD